uniref:Putative maelstrom n=1 Tax=Culex tarsalis TaxID=7177 RepID=A0A1Q3EX98_CULTA
MALVKYCLETGVMNKMHEYINPQKIPLGLALDAKNWSEETHRLPVPPDSMGETDFTVLLEKLLNFIDFDEEKKCKNFLLFTDAKEVAGTENLLSQFTEDSKILFPFLVCPLGEFFYQLKVATERYGLGLDKPNFPGRTLADILLKKDPYEYTGGISCDFHENLGNPRYCALSRVIRWSYIISDNCCLDLNIEVISGQHLPANADTTLCSEITQSDSKAFDGMSFVSASDLTHVSLPKILKQGRSKSPFRNMDDINGSVIYSSRAGFAKDCDQKSVISDKLNETNPFYAALQGRAGPSSSHETKYYNPFSRQTKLEETRQPRDVGVVGHGRGALLSGLLGKPLLASSGDGFESQSAATSSVGGGCDSSVKFSDCDED